MISYVILNTFFTWVLPGVEKKKPVVYGVISPTLAIAQRELAPKDPDRLKSAFLVITRTLSHFPHLPYSPQT